MESLSSSPYNEEAQNPYEKLHGNEPDIVEGRTGEPVDRDPTDENYVLGWE